MKKLIIKIALLFVSVALSCAGFSAIGSTFAYFNDIEISGGNIYSAGILDFSLFAPENFSPPILFPGQTTTTRTISINNNGSLDFQYTVRASEFSGELCDYLHLTANLDGGEFEYDGSLTDFNYGPVEYSNTEDWLFVVSLDIVDLIFQNKSCEFKFIFNGWQAELIDPLSGFSDIEEIINNISTEDWLPEVEVEYPNGGEVWYLVPDTCAGLPACSQWCQDNGMNVDCEYPIAWTATNRIGADVDLLIDLYFSGDSGSTWMAQIVNDINNSGVFWWKPPYHSDYITSNGRIKAVATHQDYTFLTNWDMSDADFCPPLLSLDDIFNWGVKEETTPAENTGGIASVEDDISIPAELPLEDLATTTEDVATTTVATTTAEEIIIENATTTENVVATTTIATTTVEKMIIVEEATTTDEVIEPEPEPEQPAVEEPSVEPASEPVIEEAPIVEPEPEPDLPTEAPAGAEEGPEPVAEE